MPATYNQRYMLTLLSDTIISACKRHPHLKVTDALYAFEKLRYQYTETLIKKRFPELRPPAKPSRPYA
jgi:hypothetical protein